MVKLKKVKGILSAVIAMCMTLMSITEVHAEVEVEVTAPSAILMEQGTGKILFEKGADEVRTGASLMKIMPLLIAMERIDENKLSLSDVVTASDNAASVKGADVWIKSGETMKVEELIKAIAMVSANDATVALAERIAGSEQKFVDMENEKVKQLGMENTVFKDSVGSEESGSTTSAKDVAVMSRELMRYKDIIPYCTAWIDHLRDGQTQIVNTNKMVRSYQGTTGLKTGTSEKSGSCISATAERNGLKLIAVIMGCSNSKDRFKDAAALLDMGFSEYKTVKPRIPDDIADSVKVKNGMQSEVEVTAEADGEFLVKKGKENSISCDVQLNEELLAPISKGQEAGKLIYKLDDEILAEYSIYTLYDVEEINFKSVLYGIVLQFLRL